MRKIYLSLTGGLGNQLFQMAAALQIANGDEIEVEWVNSRPRLNSGQEPEISDFTLPVNVKFQKWHKFQAFSSKSVGYILRAGVNPRKYESSKLFRHTTAFLASIANIATFRKFIRIYVNKGVGYSHEFSLDEHKSLHLVGYFQTYKWVEKYGSTGQLENIKVRNQSPQLMELIELAATEYPLVVHMRFGDYRLENSFGLLTSRYYRDSIRELWKSEKFKSIWVFSDEIDQAQKYLSECEFKDVRYIPDVAKSSAQTLEAMRLGKGYVIGNSSFSWWAARLSFNEEAPVIAPTPWFIGQSEPTDLIPPNWIRMMGHTE